MYDDLKQRIPRAECKSLYDVVSSEAKAIDPKLEIEIMGSYRRGSPDSGDVDFLITRDDSDGLNHAGVIRRLVERLMVRGVITHEVRPEAFEMGWWPMLSWQLSAPHDWRALEAKWMGVCRLNTHSLHRRIGASSNHGLATSAHLQTSFASHTNSGVPP